MSGIGPIRFRGRSFMAFALAPGLPVIEWLAQLDDWMRNSNGFFVGRPVILDLTSIELRRAEIEHLLSELQTRGIRIMGFEGAEPDELGPNMPPVLKGGRTVPIDRSGHICTRGRPNYRTQCVNRGQALLPHIWRYTWQPVAAGNRLHFV